LRDVKKKRNNLNKILPTARKNISLESKVIAVLFILLFIYFILQPALYSPDTYSYIGGYIYRSPVYVIFLRIFQFIFGSFFDYSVVGFQLILGFSCIYIIYKNLSTLLKLKLWQKILVFLVLIFPYFPPLSIGNNITSEGISYPLYLVMISFAIDFLYREKDKSVYLFSIVFIVLSLTRGQFFIVAPILAFLFILRERKSIFSQKNILLLALILLIPFIANTLDKSYHKIIHGHFVTTPFSFVNAMTLPLFVSHKEDVESLKNKDHKVIFSKTHSTIEQLGLLNANIDKGNSEKYKIFHQNVPIICNQTFHKTGLDHYENVDTTPNKNAVLIEQASKEMLPILVSNNFRAYISLYFTSIQHGFKSIFALGFVLLIFIYSGFLSLKNFTIENGILFLSTLLIISNAMIVAFASHSIIRYLFYNYFFGIILLIILFRKITSKI
jgi:hypothetical protein